MAEISNPINNNNEAYWAYVKRQFRKNKRALYSSYVIGIMAFIALFADVIANDKPLYCVIQGKSYFPVFKQMTVDIGLTKWDKQMQNFDWQYAKYDKVVYPLIPYSPTSQDFANAQYTSPTESQSISSWRFKHWLGTEKIGRDVLSALIHGTRIAFMVGLVSMSIASVLGIFFGAVAGFFGDKRIKASRISLLLLFITLILGWFYAFSVRSYILSDALGTSLSKFFVQLMISFGIYAAILLLGRIIAIPLKIIPFLRHKVHVPVDIIVQRAIEVLVSIPRMFLIIAIVAIAKPSILLVMAIIGLTSWTEIARFIRAELLKVRSLEYIEAAEALGYSGWRILFRHAIPNAIAPVLITIAFGIASAILVESFLSFIGVGFPAEILTWGKLLSLAREAPSAWWLAIFPGFAIFITVTLFNLVGEGLTDALDPRQKR
jgi:peptide/nickel transport system permease protein